ncbi:MAG: hypothetical protein R6U96_13350 [Promethearchaeia archaeon]
MDTDIDLQQFIDENKITEDIHNQFKMEILEKICEVLEKNPKYVITHDHDPPYDHSGSLVKISDHFLLSLYNTIGDFLEEYSGNDSPTHQSGYGLHHDSILNIIEDDYPIFFTWVYTKYYISLLQKKYGDEDFDEEMDAIYDLLDADNWKLFNEIKEVNICDAYTSHSFSGNLHEIDRSNVRNEIIKIITNYNENSEILIIIEYDNSIIEKWSFHLKDIKNPDIRKSYSFESSSRGDFNPDSEYIKFNYLLNNAINNAEGFVLTLKTKRSDGKIEMRSLYYIDEMINYSSAHQLEASYSTDSITGDPIKPPKNYIFCDFDERE